MKQFIEADLIYVWPDFMGESRGLSIEPLYPNQVKAIQEDELLYKLLAMIDVIRAGKVRELNIAIKELRKIILHGL